MAAIATAHGRQMLATLDRVALEGTDTFSAAMA